jgi:translocation and assembly module TamA
MHLRVLLLLAPATVLLTSGVAAQETVPLPEPSPPLPSAEPALDLDAPMADLGDGSVDWPTLAAEPEAGAGAADDPARERRYAFAIEGLGTLDRDAGRPVEATLRARFALRSALKAGEDDPAPAGLVDRRARADADILRDLLRGLGYYDAAVNTLVDGQAPRLQVHLRADPGPLYRFEAVTVTGLEGAAAALRPMFTVEQGDPVDADRIAEARAALQLEIGRRGFPFADVGSPQVSVDHARQVGTLQIAIVTGGERRFGRFRLEGRPPFDAAHLAEIARLQPGDRFDASMIEDLRRALVATGLVSTVRITPVAGESADLVDLLVRLQPAPPRTVAAELGYGTGEGVRAELSWQHRNLLPPEGAVTFRGVLGTREQQLGAILRRGNFRQRDQVLTAQAVAAHSDLDAYDARSFLLGAGIERQTNIIWQKTWTWSYGVELLASDERALSTASGEETRRTYLVAALPTSLAYDGSDDLLNPTTGFRVSGRASPEASLRQGTFGYARLQLDASAYRPLLGVVLAGRVRVGAIAGAQADKLAPSRRFYAGGGGSVRGYGYQAIGPRDQDNDPLGGRSLAEVSAELRFRFGDFGIVPFLDAGNIYREALPRFDGLRFGTGLGVRYYTSFGPVRLDVGTPLDRRPGDSRVAVYVSLGQAF